MEKNTSSSSSFEYCNQGRSGAVRPLVCRFLGLLPMCLPWGWSVFLSFFLPLSPSLSSSLLHTQRPFPRYGPSLGPAADQATAWKPALMDAAVREAPHREHSTMVSRVEGSWPRPSGGERMGDHGRSRKGQQVKKQGTGTRTLLRGSWHCYERSILTFHAV